MVQAQGAATTVYVWCPLVGTSRRRWYGVVGVVIGVVVGGVVVVGCGGLFVLKLGGVVLGLL